ncbi:aminoglycoside phosphotransferase family protein [Streptomyces doebereineriae]|uniref:Aminoglycoside phosphotransferase family protein n=1 Tax=Streptomyces doebereineriae TaxID=3075528 RepID=A0ABU2VHT1_9ACTN|nr:aminoglycoside phosphotransferase family protein [Streptomyces sp. DSM 41640]MDT0485149.1 aminoglycoside phosphotransferase family protein [Streptomyces sp. DSM 41640]
MGAPMVSPGPGADVLAKTCPPDKPIDSLVVGLLTRFLTRLALVRKDALPPLPAEWSRNERDSRAYLDTLVRHAKQRMFAPDWTAIGGLFAVLGVPGDALARYAEQVPALSRRPYGLMLTNLARDNVIILEGPKLSVARLDWTSASYGDPLHGLASHVVRMRYPEDQVEEVVQEWASEMRCTRPLAVSGLGRDFRYYVDFERIHAAYDDVIRAAKSLGDSVEDRRLLAVSADIGTALERAAGLLGMSEVAPEKEIADALFRWQASRVARDAEGLRDMLFRWRRDSRVPERADFPSDLVRRALSVEGVAPADRVFRGTAHLNTVVHLEDSPGPVVVRRETAAAPRRERVLLPEHAVLQVIEQSGAQIRAPRILALGYDARGRHFAIHTYEGPENRAPQHPVDGLLPVEADELVDALAALAKVDHSSLPSCEPEGGFYRWLTGRLAGFVDDLPVETLRAADQRGLPDGQVLRRILGRYAVTERTPALLHGDLNPWNLVRAGRRGGLTIIDWEMGMIGDPLYDLVRHLHLTPTRTEMRMRMFERWSGKLPAGCVVGWERDWRVYRWIEQIRSAYVDLDRMTTGAALSAPNVRLAVDAYEMTLSAATGSLGLRRRVAPKAPASLRLS